MKPFLKLILLLLFVVNGIHTHQSYAQCGAGYTSVATNWDWQYFDTLPTGNFRFTFGKSGLQYKWVGTTNTFMGSDGNQTGESGGVNPPFSFGYDLKFMKSNGVSDTIIFDDEVSNVK